MATEILRPSAAGDENAIPSQYPADSFPATDHWNKVDEAVADDYDTHLFTNSESYTRDLYELSASTGSGAINSIKIYFRLRGRTSPATICYGKPSQKSGATVTDGTEQEQPDGDWVTKSQTYATNPATSNAYTWAELDALQVGVLIKTENLSYPAYCTQVYVEVDYTPAVNVTIEPPLATIDSTGLVPTWVLYPAILVPLATIDSEGLVPTFIIDRIFSAPLATISSTGLVPVISCGVSISVPLTTIDANALSPELSTGVGVIVPLAIISVEGIAPELYLELFRALADFTNRRTTTDFTNLRTMAIITNRKVISAFTNLREWINHTGIRS